MPPQKNSGNKAAQRETGATRKNRDFIQDFLSDVRSGDEEAVYLARVLKKFGNGRVQAFFVDERERAHTVQGVIRGSFTGKAKKSIWIEDNALVLLADSQIKGPGQYEIMAVLNHDNVRDLRKMKKDIDPRILAMDITDSEQLMSAKQMDIISGGFDFDGEPDDSDALLGNEEVTAQPNARRIKEFTEEDIDDL